MKHQPTSIPQAAVAWHGLRLALFLIVVCAPPLVSSAVHAQLSWDATEINQEQSSDALSFVATFTFVNDGEYPLYIRKVKSKSRGLRVQLQSQGNTIRPGGSGRVVLKYPNRLLFEELEFAAELVTDERNSPRQTLTLRVAPKGWAEMDEKDRQQLKAMGERIGALPRPVDTGFPAVSWDLGEGEIPGGVKVIEVRFTGEDEAQVTGLRLLKGDPEHFETRVVEVEAGRLYRVEIEPLVKASDRMSRRRSVYATWRVETTLEGEAQLRAALDGPLFVQAALRLARSSMLPDGRRRN